MDTTNTSRDHLTPAASANDAAPSTLTPLAVPASEAARLCGLSRAHWWKLHSAGKVPAPVRFSARKPLWLVSELRAWLEAGAPPRDQWERMKGGRQ